MMALPRPGTLDPSRRRAGQMERAEKTAMLFTRDGDQVGAGERVGGGSVAGAFV